MFALRFDLRAPSAGAPADELYAAALEMAAWADSRGCVSVVLSEHHGAEDGYLPSPMVVAAAIAARTERLLTTVAALALPLYDPVRLAEEMCVLDLLSRGRMMFVAGLGYRASEYDMYGVDFRRRGRLADELLPVLLAARTGEPFSSHGRTLQVTPRPFTPGGPTVVWGGGSVAAARRAGRHGIGLFAQAGGPELREAYEAAAREAGHRPGMCYLPRAGEPTTVFVAEDVDRAWQELGPYLMHDVRGYAAWNPGDTTSASLSGARSVEELRAARGSHRVLSVAEAVAVVRRGGVLPLHPLVGGLPPEVAWRHLELVVDRVVPQAREGTGPGWGP